MVKGTLISSFDGKNIGPPQETRYSVYDSIRDAWYLYEEGPNYSDTYQITDWDEEGMYFLKKIESKHASPPE